MTEQAAAAAGVRRLAIPTPFRVGRVNCWLIEDEPLTLLDCGPNSGASLDALERALAAHGHAIEDLERIVISHQHIDHFGLIAILARRSGADVCALDLLAPIIERHEEAAEAHDELAVELMLRHGVPPDLVTGLRAVSQAYRAWGASAPVSHRLKDGETLEFAGRRLVVHHRPGHSPSDTVFHDAERGMLLAADHLIAHISSNPLIARPLGGKSGEPGAGRSRSLLIYLASLRETRAMELDLVLPGHGEVVTDHAKLIDERLRATDKRSRRMLRLLDDGPRTAYEIAQSVWGNVAMTQAYLTLSEVLGHMDLLTERGAVRERAEGDLIRFEATA